MGTGRTDRMWLVGGAVAAVVLVAVGWFLLISPQNGRTAALNEQTDAAHSQLAVLQHKLNELQQQQANQAQYQAELDSARAALPTQADLANFLRDLQSGDRDGGVVSGVTLGAPLEVPAGGRKVYALQLALTAGGTAKQLDGLLDYLQQQQPRAVLIKSVQMVGKDGAVNSGATISVALEVFVAEADAVPAAPKHS